MPFFFAGTADFAGFADLEVRGDDLGVPFGEDDFDCLFAELELLDPPADLLASAAERFGWAGLFELAFPVSLPDVFAPVAFEGVFAALPGVEVLLFSAFFEEPPPAEDDPDFDVRAFPAPPVDCVADFAFEPADDREPDAFSFSDSFLALPVVPPDAADLVFVAICNISAFCLCPYV